MSRLLSTILIDFKLQIRHNFYSVSLVVAIVFIVAMGQFLTKEILAVVLPVLFLVAIAGSTYLFAGGSILFEKGERTLESLILTPLRVNEYLISKTFTLTVLATVESLAIVIFTYGLDFQPIPLLLGIISMGLFYSLICFVVVFRYQSITDFLLPSLVYLTLLQMPFLDYFAIVKSPLFYLIPTQAPLLLIQAGFQQIATWQIFYGIGYSLAEIALTYAWGYRCFNYFIVNGERR
ncbi:MAG: ABC transporter permease [Cyanobacteria bacterium J007]|nr:MAG: ABC transporter permease [Cyanobacteria bacterium J007]